MAGKRKKKAISLDDVQLPASDPLAFIQADKSAVNKVRQALKALDARKAPQAQHVRQFIKKVREAVAVQRAVTEAVSTEA